MANVLLIGLVYFVAIRVARWAHYRYGPLASAPILLLLILPAARALVRLMAPGIPRLGIDGSIALLAIMIGAAALIARRKTYAVGAAVLVTLSPLIVIEGVLSIAKCWSGRPTEYADRPLALLALRSARPRVVWIVFDELDYRLAFPDRPANLALPNFDRLHAESVFATNARPPADNTLYSMNSLFTGVNLTSIATLDASHATANGIALTSLPTIFSVVHGMGENAAIDGWYLPYCRLFSADLAACSWYDLESASSDVEGPYGGIAAQQQSLFEFGYVSFFRQSLRARHRAGMIEAMTGESRRYAADPSFDFVLLHLPAPHPPHFYDRFSGTFTKRAGGPAGYPDSLALADRMLCDIRESMTRAGLWDKSTVLVSSDHPNRAASAVDGRTDARVPFLLKVAGQTSGVAYPSPLRTIVTQASAGSDPPWSNRIRKNKPSAGSRQRYPPTKANGTRPMEPQPRLFPPRQRPGEQNPPRAGHYILPSIELICNRRTLHRRPATRVPQRFSVAGSQCQNIALSVARENPAPGIRRQHPRARAVRSQFTCDHRILPV